MAAEPTLGMLGGIAAVTLSAAVGALAWRSRRRSAGASATPAVAQDTQRDRAHRPAEPRALRSDAQRRQDKSNAFAARFGHESYVPLVARVLTAGTSEAARAMLSALQINAPNLALISARPARDGDGIVLHLREIEGHPAVAEFSAGTSAVEVNVLEEPLREAGNAARFAPLETKFIKVHGLKPGF